MKNLLCLLLFIFSSNTTTSSLPEPSIIIQDCEQAIEVKRSYTDMQIILLAVKSREGLRLQSYPDVGSWSIGWGTASREGAVITVEEANERMLQAYQKSLAWVKAEFPDTDN